MGGSDYHEAEKHAHGARQDPYPTIVPWDNFRDGTKEAVLKLPCTTLDKSESDGEHMKAKLE